MPFVLVPSKIFLRKLAKLDRSVVIELERKLEALKQNPVASERRMHHSYNYFRIYIRNFRLIYKVEGNQITLFDIIKRGEGYEKFMG
ncbi:MAG: type II toxin-antitoxin system RelE/ParE family toxin [Candidatus Micrarchaeota archaeon]|nr:type II toxin-antitoxin system RelE/ParE family toxin [Candidatus Micrarchaeota archaeon]